MLELQYKGPSGITRKKGPADAARSSRRCMIFNCDRRRGNYCCEDCGYKKSGGCKNPCLNGPERCGQAAAATPRSKTAITEELS